MTSIKTVLSVGIVPLCVSILALSFVTPVLALDLSLASDPLVEEQSANCDLHIVGSTLYRYKKGGTIVTVRVRSDEDGELSLSVRIKRTDGTLIAKSIVGSANNCGVGTVSFDMDSNGSHEVFDIDVDTDKLTLSYEGRTLEFPRDIQNQSVQ